ncbi:MAG: hypothetical protein D6B26_01825 [Spirochaetaceae bacterium]|nr:MAG: hypothetical protein D6B26_01825 [Spirochaetaceae bacterium]
MFKSALAASKVLLLAFLLAFPGILGAMDLGVSVDSSSDVQVQLGGYVLEHMDTITLWGLRQARESGELGFSWRVYYRYSTERMIAFDVDELYLTAQLNAFANRSIIKVGRFTHRDWSGVVFSHAMDGLHVYSETGVADFRAVLGTTAFIAGHNASIFLSSLDSQNRDAMFGSPRAVAGIGARFTQIVDWFVPSLDSVLQYELRPDSDIAVNTQHVIARFDFGIGSRFALQPVLAAMLVQSTDGQATREYGYLGTLRLQYIQAGLAGLIVQGEGWYASGAGDSAPAISLYSAGAYRPVSTVRVTRIYPLDIGGSMGGKVVLGFNPFKSSDALWLQESRINLQAVGLMQSAWPQIAQADFFTTRYLGTDLLLSLVMRAAPELGFRLGGGVFVPGPALADQELITRILLDISLTI